MTRSLSPKCVTHYDTFSLNVCKDVSGLCEAFIRKLYCFKGAVNLSDADKSADELRYVRVAVVSFILKCFGGGSYYINKLPSLIYDICAYKMFLTFQKKLKKFLWHHNRYLFLFETGYGTVFEPLWLSIFLIEPNVEILAQTVYVFLQNKKAVT